MGWRTTSRPSTFAQPASGCRRVASTLTRVVLPAPFGPSRPTTDAAGTWRSTPSRARVSPKALPTPDTSIMGSAIVGSLMPPFLVPSPYRNGPHRYCERDVRHRPDGDRSPAHDDPSGPPAPRPDPARPDRPRAGVPAGRDPGAGWREPPALAVDARGRPRPQGRAGRPVRPGLRAVHGRATGGRDVRRPDGRRPDHGELGLPHAAPRRGAAARDPVPARSSGPVDGSGDAGRLLRLDPPGGLELHARGA